MNTQTVGIVMLVVGIIGLVGVYSMRPPSGFGEALMMMGQGRQFFIRAPWVAPTNNWRAQPALLELVFC